MSTPSAPATKTRQTFSVVIPAFDEEDTIAACLDLLLQQLDDIDEIVVVDNNSSDRTNEIVAEYADREPAVLLVTESKPGAFSARNAGFNAAKGDLLGRIDADTAIRPGWAKAYRAFFEADADHRWGAAHGRGVPYGVPGSRFRADEPAAVKRTIPSKVLYGANMVMRRSAWDAVKDSVSERRDVFEDVDLGLTAGEKGHRVAYLTGIHVGVSPRRWFSNPVEAWRYNVCSVRAMRLHGEYPLAAAMYAGLPIQSAIHTVRWAALSAYDEKEQRWSLAQLRRRRVARVLP